MYINQGKVAKQEIEKLEIAGPKEEEEEELAMLGLPLAFGNSRKARPRRSHAHPIPIMESENTMHCTLTVNGNFLQKLRQHFLLDVSFGQPLVAALRRFVPSHLMTECTPFQSLEMVNANCISLHSFQPTPVDQCPVSLQSVSKYWMHRLDILGNFDEVCWELDEESWYSITPEALALHHAAQISAYCQERLENASSLCVWDAFGGVGGNVVGCLREGHRVWMSDIHARRVASAQSISLQLTAAREGRLQVICAAAQSLLCPAWVDLFDCLIWDPPWGGPDIYNASQLLGLDIFPIECLQVLQFYLQHCPSGLALLFVPKTLDIAELLAWIHTAFSSSPTRAAAIDHVNVNINIERNYQRSKLVGLTLYVTWCSPPPSMPNTSSQSSSLTDT